MRAACLPFEGSKSKNAEREGVKMFGMIRLSMRKKDGGEKKISNEGKQA